MSKKTTSYVQTLSKGLQILEFLAEKKSTTVTSLAKEMGLQKSASYRFLNTLRLHGYVEQDKNNNYDLTNRLENLGKGIVPKLEFHNIATRVLNDLTKNHVAMDAVSNIGFWNGKDVVYIAQSTHNTYMQFREGSTVPAYCSALGKAILAYLPDSEVEEYIQSTEFTPFTEATTTSADALRQELQKTREQQYAVMCDELCLGLKGIAIPLILENHPIKYAISFTQTLYGPITPLVENFYPLLQEAAEEIKSYMNLGIHKNMSV